MVAAKYGSSDPDLKSRVGKRGKTKEMVDAKMLSPGKLLKTTGMVGGVANDHQTNRDAKKSGPKGSVTRSP
jgi:hypothetical protein